MRERERESPLWGFPSTPVNSLAASRGDLVIAATSNDSESNDNNDSNSLKRK